MCPDGREKINCFANQPKLKQNPCCLVPQEGRIAIVTERGTGCDGRGSVGRVVVFAGRALVRERTQRADDRRGCVRQNRVVLAPVAGVKLTEVRRPYRV